MALTLVMRLVLGLIGWVVASRRPLPASVDPAEALSQSDSLWAVVGPWQRLDAINYQRIIEHGYSNSPLSAPFFPLYPGLTRLAAAPLANQAALAGLVVSTLCTAAALALLHRLLRDDLGVAIADRAVLYLGVAPTAFFLLAPYSESLFLLLTVGTFMAARRRHLPLAALLCTAATLTRPQGILVLAPVGVEAIAAVRDRSGQHRLRLHLSDLTLLIPPLALVAYFVLLERAVGVSPITGQTAWGVHAVAPWQGLIDSVRAAEEGYLGQLVNLAAIAALAATCVAAWRHQPCSYAIFAIAMLLPLLLEEKFMPDPLGSADRFLAVVFPLFAALARSTIRRPPWHLLVLVAFPLLMLRLFILFVQGDFAG